MSNLLILLVPLLYGGIQALEISAILARFAGLRVKRNMTGYALQQSIYMGTRFLLVLLLPLLGLAVDSGLALGDFAAMTQASLLSAAVLGGIVVIFRTRLVCYYEAVLNNYDRSGNYVSSFFARPTNNGESETRPIPLSLPKDRIVFLSSIFVFTIYATGMFGSFYIALLIPEYRASISQASGVINALGAVLLTFFVEPTISRHIDRSTDDAPRMIISLMLGRLVAVAITGQAVLFLLFWSL